MKGTIKYVIIFSLISELYAIQWIRILSNSFECPEPFGKYPFANDCQSYYLCWQWGTNIKSVYAIRHCPPNMLLDVRKQQCVFNKMAVCHQDEPFTCPTSNGLFRNKQCDRYWLCYNDRSYLRYCPYGMKYDVLAERCLAWMEAQCDEMNSEQPENVPMLTTATSVADKVTNANVAPTSNTLPSSIITERPPIVTELNDHSSKIHITTSYTNESNVSTTIAMDPNDDDYSQASTIELSTIVSTEETNQMNESIGSSVSFEYSTIKASSDEPNLEVDNIGTSLQTNGSTTKKPVLICKYIYE